MREPLAAQKWERGQKNTCPGRSHSRGRETGVPMAMSVGHRGGSHGSGYASGAAAAAAAYTGRCGDTSRREDAAAEAQPSPKGGKSHLVTAWTADGDGTNQSDLSK